MNRCYCIGPQNGDKMCPCMMQQNGLRMNPKFQMPTVQDNKSGFFPLPSYQICNDPEHNVPSHLYVPAGQGYRHICPKCGYQQTVINALVTMANEHPMSGPDNFTVSKSRQSDHQLHSDVVATKGK